MPSKTPTGWANAHRIADDHADEVAGIYSQARKETVGQRLDRERKERITAPGVDVRKKPPPGETCKEAALGLPFYFPCGKPAEFMIENRGEVVPLCFPCADHNVRNRGANYQKES